MTNTFDCAIINLTPHILNIVHGDLITEVKPEEKPARVSSKVEVVGYINDNIPLYDTIYGDVIDLPAQQDGVIYVVSRIVKNCVPDRKDVLVPGNLLRDDKGNVIGCNGLSY